MGQPFMSAVYDYFTSVTKCIEKKLFHLKPKYSIIISNVKFPSGYTGRGERILRMNLLKQLLTVFGFAMVPVFELRGAIPIGVASGLPFWSAFLTAFLGNLLPVPFLILFTRRIFEWLRKKSSFLERLVSRMEKKAASKEELLKKYELLGLCILVAIPLPGTGAWTGSLVAAVFDIRLKHAFPAIALGVLIAGVIVSIVTYGVTIFI